MDNIGNLTTIIKTISMFIAGWAIGTATAHNLDMGMDASMLAEIISAFFFLILAYLDAKYPNTFKFLGNNKPALGYPVSEVVLNEEYETDVEDEDYGN